MTRAAVLERVRVAPEEALAMVEAVLDGVAEGRFPSPYDSGWQAAVRAMDKAALALAERGEAETADRIDRLIETLTRVFPVVECDDDLDDEERSALAEADAEVRRGEAIPHDEVKRELGLT